MRNNEFKHRAKHVPIDLDAGKIILVKKLQAMNLAKKDIRTITGVGYTQQDQIKKEKVLLIELSCKEIERKIKVFSITLRK